MKNVIKILLLSLICMAARCQDEGSENCHTAIRFSNNSQKVLYVRDVHYIPQYPFASQVAYIHNTVQETYKIKSNEQNNKKAMVSVNCYEKRFMKGDYYSDTIIVYVFDAAVVENTPWEVVANDYLVLKRYDLTLGDLQSVNWELTYPPAPNMSGIKMYPPYKEDE